MHNDVGSISAPLVMAVGERIHFQKISLRIKPGLNFKIIDNPKTIFTFVSIPTPSGSLGCLVGPSLGREVDPKNVRWGSRGAPLGLPPSSLGREEVTLIFLIKFKKMVVEDFFRKKS